MDPRGWLLQKSQVRPKHLDDVFRDPLEAGYHLTGGLLRLRYGALGRRFFVPKKTGWKFSAMQEMRHGFYMIYVYICLYVLYIYTSYSHFLTCIYSFKFDDVCIYIYICIYPSKVEAEHQFLKSDFGAR